MLQSSFSETKMHKGCHKIPLICNKSLTPSMTTFNALSLLRTFAYITEILIQMSRKFSEYFTKVHTSDPMDPTDCYPTYLYLRPIMPPTYDRRQPPKYMRGNNFCFSTPGDCPVFLSSVMFKNYLISLYNLKIFVAIH